MPNISEINSKNDLPVWESNRFGLEKIISFGEGTVFFEDDDPRIVLVTDKWGDKSWVIGYIEKLTLSCSEKPVDGYLISLRVRDNAVIGLHPDSIDSSSH